MMFRQPERVPEQWSLHTHTEAQWFRCQNQFRITRVQTLLLWHFFLTLIQNRDKQNSKTERQIENYQEQQRPEQGLRSRVLCAAAAYSCILKSEWTTTWPFITKGSLSTHYWCSECRVENTCCHQGVTDVMQHTFLLHDEVQWECGLCFCCFFSVLCFLLLSARNLYNKFYSLF